jgi:starch phosphorylase
MPFASNLLRPASYKRADFLFSNLEGLKRIAQQVEPFQLIYTAKAHPPDEAGKAVIRRIFELIAAAEDILPIACIENYDMCRGELIRSGVDVWLNTPHRPYEASRTSGTKTALDGVPSWSVTDGWWREGQVEGAKGWDIGDEEIPDSPEEEIASLHHKL